jgi:hypothetical protein
MKTEMKKTNNVLVFRTLPFIADSRVKRYLSLFPETSNVIFKTWEKESINVANVQAYPFLKGGNVLKKAVNFLGYQLFSLYYFLKLQKGDIAVFMDLDTALLPMLFKWVKPNVTAIFDIVDPISQTKGLRFKSLHKFIDRLEYNIAVKSDLCIVPHACRIEYYYNRLNVTKGSELNSFVIENVPDKFSTALDTLREGNKLSIGYFGTLDEKTRGLEELLEFAIDNNHIDLLFAGDGSLKASIEESAKVHNNISYSGPYNYSDLQDIYNQVDFTWAYYSPEVSLHAYACPNKYFEHIMFLTPIITNSIIPQAQAVKLNGSGIVIERISDIYSDDFKSSLASFKADHSSLRNRLKETRLKYSCYYQTKAEELQVKLAEL